MTVIQTIIYYTTDRGKEGKYAFIASNPLDEDTRALAGVKKGDTFAKLSGRMYPVIKRSASDTEMQSEEPNQ